jgi:hypothetical protein
LPIRGTAAARQGYVFRRNFFAPRILSTLFSIAFSLSFAYYTLFLRAGTAAFQPLSGYEHKLDQRRLTNGLGCAAYQTCIFPGGESDMTLCRSTSKKRRKPQMEIRNQLSKPISNPSSNLISTPASHLRYNLTVHGF